MKNDEIKQTRVDVSGFAFDAKTGESLGQMYGTPVPQVPNHIHGITKYERYEFWLECACGYGANSVLATFCGGCGHSVKLPEHVALALKKDRVESVYLEDGQWYAQVWENYVRHKVALRPELNGDYTI